MSTSGKIFLGIIIGFTVLVIALIIYGVTTHTEPGLMAETPGFAASDLPIQVCAGAYQPEADIESAPRVAATSRRWWSATGSPPIRTSQSTCQRAEPSASRETFAAGTSTRRSCLGPTKIRRARHTPETRVSHRDAEAS
jgi:hypothetical protein